MEEREWSTSPDRHGERLEASRDAEASAVEVGELRRDVSEKSGFRVLLGRSEDTSERPSSSLAENRDREGARGATKRYKRARV